MAANNPVVYEYSFLNNLNGEKEAFAIIWAFSARFPVPTTRPIDHL
jgi:hypothetical protein